MTKRLRVSPRLTQPTSKIQLEKYALEIKRMFEILPNICKDFGVPLIPVEFDFGRSRDNGGSYDFEGTKRVIYVSPKPWQGSMLDVFTHEFAHYLQDQAGRMSFEFRREFGGYEKRAGDGHGWSFYEILVLVVDHMEMIYSHVYNWSHEYPHLKSFRLRMSPTFIDKPKMYSLMNLGMSEFDAVCTLIKIERGEI